MVDPEAFAPTFFSDHHIQIPLILSRRRQAASRRTGNPERHVPRSVTPPSSQSPRCLTPNLRDDGTTTFDTTRPDWQQWAVKVKRP